MADGSWRLGQITILGLLATAIIVPSRSVAADVGIPAWKKPTPGTAGFLGTGLSDTQTVCDTVAHYQQWVLSEPPAKSRGCVSFDESIPVVVMGVEPKPLKDEIGSTSMALVKIRIASKGFVGFLPLLNIRPKIPSGARIIMEKGNSLALRLADTPDAAEDAGLDLGEQATAEVVTYDPAGYRNLQVTITGGAYQGKIGWVSSIGVTSEDGDPVTWFSGTTIGEPDRPKIATPILSTLTDDEQAQLYQWMMHPEAITSDTTRASSLGLQYKAHGDVVSYSVSTRHSRLDLNISSMLPEDARSFAARACNIAETNFTWSQPWTIRVFLTTGERPAAQCEIR